MNEEYQDQPTGKRQSPAKSAVAQQKPRDAEGHFLSGQEAAQYNQMRQAQQLQAERDRMSQLLGKSSSGGFGQTQQSSIQGIPEDKFRNILNANMMGGRGQQQMQGVQTPEDKWATLLGKKRTKIDW